MDRDHKTVAQEKWMALILWGVLLFILIMVTESLFLSLRMSFGIQSAFLYAQSLQAENGAIPVWFILIPFLVMIALLVLAWQRFFHFSRRLLISFSRKTGPEESPSIFLDFLHFDGRAENPQPENATGSIVGRILGLVGLMIIGSLITLAIVVAVASFITSR